MRQLQFSFRTEAALDAELRKIRQWHRNNLYSTAVIQLYTDILDREMIERVCGRIRDQLPGALIVGCSSNGNIMNGDFCGNAFAAACTLFEYPTTRVETLQYPLTAETQTDVTRRLCDEVRARPWVKAVGMLVTIRGMSVSALCDGLSRLPEGVQVFGGGAFCEDLDRSDACVFSGDGGYQEKSVVFVLLGGEDLHIDTGYVTGWKPLGLYLDVTATRGEMLLELNGRPAYETYYKYLHIKNDENFFYNTLEFPFLYRLNGIDIMRAPTASNPDGSLTMTADIDQGVKARIAYGDPWTILDSVWQEGNRLLKFAPECILVFSCAARRTFWGNAEVGKETEPYQIVAPTSGFYTSGEFLRTNGFVNQHNVTQVIVGLREGEPRPHPEQEIRMADHSFEGKVSMINRMATFIKATTEELAEVNAKLEEANRRLSELAITDALTGIGNKAAYIDRVRELDARIAEGDAAFSVAVFDLNGLKAINDSRGHECGDIAITDTAHLLCDVFGRGNLYRIGGDEFIAVLPETAPEAMRALFDRLDDAIVAKNRTPGPYGVPLALSRGWATVRPGEDTAYHAVFKRADDAMYRDKAEYYKTHDRRKR
ncbi:MAG: diguanylate cyclase [Clostridia bacterium]|nr:diguanylate cyclase [Clostridia bacterium]